MDYLQGAIEKARQQREGAIGRTPVPGEQVPDHGQVKSGLDARVGVSTAESQKAPVEYTCTRHVELDPAVLAENRVIAGNVDDPRVEVYRQLRSQVLSRMKRDGYKTLAITSPQEGAGKSLTAVNLAITMSQEVNQTVMLVDLDLRAPSLSETLGIEIDKGIVDHLMHGEPLDEILLNPGFPRLVLLPGRPQGRHSSEILTSPAMNRFLGDITARYSDRIVIFDLPPLLRNDDAMVFVPYTDACLMIVEEGLTTSEDLERSIRLLDDVDLLGTVLNKAK